MRAEWGSRGRRSKSGIDFSPLVRSQMLISTCRMVQKADVGDVIGSWRGSRPAAHPPLLGEPMSRLQESRGELDADHRAHGQCSYPIARIIAKMPCLTGSGSRSQHSITSAKSGERAISIVFLLCSHCADFVLANRPRGAPWSTSTVPSSTGGVCVTSCACPLCDASCPVFSPERPLFVTSHGDAFCGSNPDRVTNSHRPRGG